MKLLAKRNSIDHSMIELYTTGEGPTYLVAVVHEDMFALSDIGEIIPAIEEVGEAILNISLVQ